MNSSQQQTSARLSNTGFKARLVAASLLATLGLFAFPADVPVAFWAKSTHPPKELMRYLDLAEVFGHGIGVTMIMIGTFALIVLFSFHRFVGLQSAGLPFSPQRKKDVALECWAGSCSDHLQSSS